MFNNFIITGFADEIAPMLDKQIAVIKKLGISHIEMRGVDGKGLVEYSLDDAMEIKSRLDADGIRLSSVGSPIGKLKITDDFAPHMELFKHTVELAHLMGTPNIRIFSFFIPKDEQNIYKEIVMERLAQLVDYAVSNNVILLHENEKGIYGEKAAGCKEIMDNFFGNNFKAVFDFANFVQAQQDTMEAYEMLKDYIAYVHIKDAVWSDRSVVPAGYGDGNVKEILKLIKENGYKGFLSLEPHLSKYTGTGKKLDGAEAFSLAYEALIKILDELH